MGSEHLAVEGRRDSVLDGYLVDITEAGEGVVAFDIADCDLALGTYALSEVDVEAGGA